jgi:hypothetical protein
MRYIDTTETTVKKIKALGRQFSRERGVELHEGQRLAAQTHGYDDMHHVTHCASITKNRLGDGQRQTLMAKAVLDAELSKQPADSYGIEEPGEGAASNGDIQIRIEWPVRPCQLGFQIGEGELGRAIRRVMFAMAIRDTRRYLDGVLIEASGDELTFVASDGHVLACTKIAVPVEMECARAILPSSGVRKLAARLRSNDLPVVVRIDGGKASFWIDAKATVMDLLGGVYPNYVKILEAERPKRVDVDREMMLDALTRMPTKEEELFPVVMRMESNFVELQGHETKLPFSCRLEVQYGGEATRIVVNRSDLMAALGGMQGRMLRLDFGNGYETVLLSDSGGHDFKVALSPLRM